MSEDYSVPRNLTNTLFQDLQLPQHSKMYPKGESQSPDPKNRASITSSKYRQTQDNDFLQLQLGQQSSIQKNTVRSNKDSTDTSSDSRPSSKATPKSRMMKRRKNNKPETEPKKEVDIDEYIGQVAEWTQKGVRNNEEEEDFNGEAGNLGETAQQLAIRKKLEDKLKNGFGQKTRTGGLQAKADQLKKANMAQISAEKAASSAEDLLDKKVKKVVEETSHETSTTNMTKKQPKKLLEEESEEDPWEKVNQNTIKHYERRKQKQKDMNVDMVLKFYQQQFQFDQEIIEIQEEQDQKEQSGCFQMLCSCFKSEEPSKEKNNIALAKRFIGISKKQLTNTDEQYFILQEIWTRLKSTPFSRFGGHWNEIGFQGRDPATDLRSTGVLSILQWLLFLENHPKEGKQFATWSMENQYPLALTHIKITGVFLDLVLRGKIRGSKWEDFQRSYNALMLEMLKKMKSQFKGGDTMGTLVEEEARQIKKSYKKSLSLYLSEYKK